LRDFKAAVGLAVALGFLAVGPSVEAARIDGNVRLFTGFTELGDLETNVTEQRAQVSLTQPIGPWLNLGVHYRHTLNRTSTDQADFERRADQPEAFLTYSRSTFTMRLSYFDRSNSGTNPRDNFDSTLATVIAEWRPKHGPRYQIQYRDGSNVADPQLFSRDTDSTDFQFDAVYAKSNWSARGSWITSKIDNNVTGFVLDQDRLLFRSNYSNGFFDDRLSFWVEGWLSEVRQTQVAPTGSMLAQPVPAVQGLYVLDPTPIIGSLEPSPGLIDGDTQTPVVPRIEIGGSNLFRNIGVDLGVTNRVTRLEITVDTLSDPSLVWELYQSPDNFNWRLVGAVSNTFDEAFLRYTLVFPETVDRYFKAVNVSPNVLTNVAVTEIRALLDVAQLGRDEAKSSTYRVDARTHIRPSRRLRGSVLLFASNDVDIAAGRVSQEINEFSVNLPFQYEISRTLMLTFGYLLNSFEQNLTPVLSRTERRYSTGLQWTPIPNVRGRFNLDRREESDQGRLIRRTDSARAVAMLQIFPDMHLNSELIVSEVDDFANRFTQRVLRWIESLETRPTQTWRVGGGWTASWFDSTGILTVDQRLTLQLFTTWQIVPYLGVSANLDYTIDDIQESLDQRYSVFWSPGRKLTASLYYQDSESVDLRRIRTYGGSLSYRLNRWFTLFANAADSKTEDFGIGATQTRSGRLGFNLNF